MPPKKRSNHSKATPSSSSTTSTSHAHADHPHHNTLRGRSTGPITRARASSKPPPPPERTPASHLKDAVIVEEGQGKKEEKKSKLAAAVPRIGGSTKFARFVYVLTSIAVVLLVWYAYGMVTLLARLKDEVGWWSVVVGGDSAMARGGRGMRVWEGISPWLTTKGWGFGSGAGAGGDRRGGGDLEGSLNALADALGVDPVEVALAVRPLVPRASMASKAGRTGGSEAVRVLFEDVGGHDGRTIVQDFAEHDTAEGEVLD